MPNKKTGPKGQKLSIKQDFALMGRLLKMMLKYYPWQMPLAALLIIISAVANVCGTLFIGQILIGHYINIMLGNTSELVTNGSPLVNILPADFGTAIIIMICIYVVGILATYGYQMAVAIIGQGTQRRIRDSVFSHMESLPLRYFDSRPHGDIMSVYTNDIDTLREMTSRVLPTLVNSIVTMIVALIAMIASSWLLTLVVLGFTAIILTCVIIITHKSAGYFIGQQIAIGKVDGYVEEMISGQKVIKVFNHEKEATADFDILNNELCDYTTAAQKFSSILGPVVNNLTNLLYCVLLLVGGIGIAFNWPTVGVGMIVTFLSLGRSFTMPISMVSNQINFLVMAMAGAARIFELQDEPSEIDDGYVTLVRAEENEDGSPKETDTYTGKWAWKHPHTDGSGTTYTWMKGKVNMYDVDFGYVPEKVVLHGIKLYAEPGQKVAFVGPTGAGKTTITNLLSRFYDIADGKIRIDDININKIKKHDLRIAIGMVLQDTNLFTGTVMDNIRYGNPNASEEEVVKAAKLANADNFIRMLPDGYNTILHSAGAGLSQGQRQLLSIARAACANPPILILDEATSSIDSRTEKLVQQGMDAIMKGRTVFVIAHRLSTIQNSDVIMVLENGRIIERGSHDSLLAEKGKYYQLYTGGKATK